VKLEIIVNRVAATINLPGVAKNVYEDAGRLLAHLLSEPSVKNRDAIAEAFVFLLKKCPSANASDLWHHIVYRQYSEMSGL
jgi:hypothetical protein